MIAVVGMAMRAPGCADLAAYWKALRDGEVLIRRLTEVEREGDAARDSTTDAGTYVPVGGFLDDVSGIDTALFTMTPREAALTDPQHRLFLELCWEALEDAGWAPGRRGAGVGVFGGCGESAYYHRHVLPSGVFGSPVEARIRNDKDFLTTWVSYQLGLTGPSIAVQTACSTSLVAVDAAVRSLEGGECDLALAGGVTIKLPHPAGYHAIEGGIESPSGRCLPFDADANGIVGGSGGGVVALRRLRDAVADGDAVYCCIAGSAVSNDGRDKVGFTAPSVSGQRRTLSEALTRARMSPDAVTYIEAHATGTRLGDPIELAAIGDVYRAGERPCRLGSVKGNIGHLDAAAGVASLIKAALAIRHRFVPGNPWLRTVNPECALEGSRFELPREGTPWEAQGEHGLCAAVSSFGVGGTNAHLVLRDADAKPHVVRNGGMAVPVVLSAATAAALTHGAARLADELVRRPELDLDLAATQLCLGRTAHRFRWTSTAVAIEGAIEELTSIRSADVASADGAARHAFLFPGQLTEPGATALALYEAWPAYRDALDARLAAAPDSVRRYLLEAEEPAGPEVTQPALIALEVSLSDALMAAGIVPAAVGGHSLGEFAAAIVAGVWRWEEALDVLTTRGALMKRMASGAMSAVFASGDAVRGLLDGISEIGVAAFNADRETVVSGALSSVQEVEARAAEATIAYRTIAVGPAFHSPLTEPILPAFRRAVGAGGRGAPTIAMYSSVTGGRLVDGPEPEHWVRQLREPVNFTGLTRAMAEEFGDALWIEVGPGQVLTRLARFAAGASGAGRFLAPLATADPWSGVLRTLGRCWETGADVQWEQLLPNSTSRNAARLPVYAFDRSAHWLAATPTATTTVAAPAPAAARATGSATADPYVAEVVREVFVAAFGHEAIRDDDDFFELGGNSLVAASLTDELRTRLGREVPMSLLFDQPTVGGLVEALSSTPTP
jgi:phthiocerol/phenolphthiocerol synthesis type-I polyketide synthase E